MAQAMTGEFWLVDAPENQGFLKHAAEPAMESIPCPGPIPHSRRAKRADNLTVIADPRAINDFTWTWMTDLLISPKVLTVFEKHHVTGFDVRPVNVKYLTRVGAKLPDLYEVIVIGWAGLPSPEAKLTVAKSCLICGRKEYFIADSSKLLDPSSWDGSDLFMVWPLPRYPFASDRLAGIIRQEGLSGVKLLPPAALRVKPDRSLAPGSIFGWMPEKRAHELSQQFGII
jgi:hypothetical protein